MTGWERTACVVRETHGHWIRQVTDALRSAGLGVVLISPPVTAEERVELAGLAEDVWVVQDVRDADAVAKTILDHTGGVAPAGVLTAAEGVIAATARVGELLGTARCPADVFVLAHNKFAVREMLAGAGLPGPRFAAIGDAAQAGAVAAEVGLPAIVKPVNGAASNLVRTVHTVGELVEAYRLLAERLPASPDARYHRPVEGRPGTRSIDPTTVFLVEGLLRGQEYAIDVLVRDGTAEPVELVGKPLIDERKFELGMCCPPLELTDERAKLITSAAVDAVRALGLDNTCAHVEVIDDELTGPTIVEVNGGRPVGGATAELLRLRTGVDMFAEMVSLALGTPPPQRDGATIPVPLGELILYPSGTGRLVRVHGLDELEELPEVISVVTTVTPGQWLSDEQEVYAVNVFVAGFGDHEELAALYADASRLIRFELEELP
ncbi:ATP-grasp domain-containing protein [Amycolatopsis marina]|uniref:ATP-grasp domain-containing protein n=1 Tax=Amycolatopsis marina TaxID=490629 RepID=A0A1I1B0W9_9PSEU|nr:ATP-grasp domain-containing protein [Amycolatopsis marina]SFB43999.1 ATP-grasp domain-containing protein [Amycolatopsis marina]